MTAGDTIKTEQTNFPIIRLPTYSRAAEDWQGTTNNEQRKQQRKQQQLLLWHRPFLPRVRRHGVQTTLQRQQNHHHHSHPLPHQQQQQDTDK